MSLRIETAEQTRRFEFVAFPAGESGIHAVENTSEVPLRCLFFSSMREPDVTAYPDDGEPYVGALDAKFSFDGNQSAADEEEPASSIFQSYLNA